MKTGGKKVLTPSSAAVGEIDERRFMAATIKDGLEKEQDHF